jgi:hypothetical protein
MVPARWRAHHRAATPRNRPGFFTIPAKARFLELIQVADALMRRDRPLITHADFLRYLDRAGALPGIGIARVYFSHARPRTDSLMETWLRLIMVDIGLPCPEVNRALTDDRGRVTRYLDLSWPELHIDLEYHGKHHFNDPEQSINDLDRRGDITEIGWQLVEARYPDLKDPRTLIRRVYAAFAHAGKPVRTA